MSLRTYLEHKGSMTSDLQALISKAKCPDLNLGIVASRTGIGIVITVESITSGETSVKTYRISCHSTILSPASQATLTSSFLIVCVSKQNALLFKSNNKHNNKVHTPNILYNQQRNFFKLLLLPDLLGHLEQ